MAKTLADLIAAAMHDVGALSSASATPSAEDSAAVSARISSIVADLAARRITGTINTSAISESVFPALVKVVAGHIAPMFGGQINADLITAAEQQLAYVYRFDRSLATPFVVNVLEQLDVFGATKAAIDAQAVSDRIPGILAELTADRVLSATAEANIPAEFKPQLARYIAAHLATPQLTEVMADARDRMARIYRLDRDGATPFVLGVLEQMEAYGVAKTAVDAQVVSDRIPQILAELTAFRTLNVATEAAIPSALKPQLTRYIAAYLATPQITDVMKDAQEKLARLYRLDRTASTPLVRAVLEQMEIYGSSTAAVDAEAVEERIPGILAELSARDVFFATDESEVNEATIPHLARYIAASLSSPQLYDVMALAEREMRRINRVKTPVVPVRALYY